MLLPTSTINIYTRISFFIIHTLILCHIVSSKATEDCLYNTKNKINSCLQAPHVWLKCFPLEFFFLIRGFATPAHSLTIVLRLFCVSVSNNKSLQEKSILNSYLFNLLPFHSLCLLLFFIFIWNVKKISTYLAGEMRESWRVYSRYHTCTCYRNLISVCMQSVFILTYGMK